MRGSMATTAMVSALNLATSVLLARRAGPTLLGEFVVLAAWAHSAFALLSPGFDQAYIRDPDRPGRWSAAVFLTLVQVLALLVLPITAVTVARLVWPGTVAGLRSADLEMLIGAITLGVAGNLLLAPLAAGLLYQQINRVRFCVALGSSLAALAFAFAQEPTSIAPFLARELAGGVLTLVLALVLSGQGHHPVWAWPKSEDLRELTTFARDLWGLNTLEKLAQRAEYLVLASVMSLSEIGTFYAVRSLFDGIHGALMVPVQTVLFAFLSRGQALAPVLSLLSPSWRTVQMAAVSLLLALAMGVAAPLFPWIFGPRYQTPFALPVAFTLLILLLSYFELVKVTLMSRGRHRDLMLGRLMQLALLCTGVPLLSMLAGLSGAAFAAVLAATGMCAVAWWVLARQGPLK